MRVHGERIGLQIGSRTILADVSPQCEAGEITALVGASGSGKTSLLHCLGLLQRPTTGRVLVDDEDTTTWSTSQRRRFWGSAASFVLQDYGMIEEDSVAANVTMRKSVWSGAPVGNLSRVDEVLEATGLAGRNDEPVVQLSGGERQRLGIARALYRDARVLLVDEPTASLDAANRQRVLDLLQLAAARGAAVVVATHDDALAHAATRQLRLDAGRHVGSEHRVGAAS